MIEMEPIHVNVENVSDTLRKLVAAVNQIIDTVETLETRIDVRLDKLKDAVDLALEEEPDDIED